MKYDPQIHHRKSMRLKGYDYSQAGAYFITICCQHMKCRFGRVVGAGFTPAQMELNEYGTIAYDEWAKLSERFSNFELDVFQIMPNHMHGIIVLNDIPVVRETLAVAQKAGASPAPTAKKATVGDIVGAYKSLVANDAWKFIKQKMKLWGNYGNAITTNTSSVTNDHIKPFLII